MNKTYFVFVNAPDTPAMPLYINDVYAYAKIFSDKRSYTEVRYIINWDRHTIPSITETQKVE